MLKVKKILLVIICFTGCYEVFGQVPKDITVALLADVSLNPLKITINWSNPIASNILLKRRKKGDSGNSWTTLLNVTASGVSSFEDNNIIEGDTYEYSIRKTTSNLIARGFAHVAVLSPVVDYRGKILVFIDSTTADAVGLELKIFKDAMRGDGWQPVPTKTGPSSTAQGIKNKIIELYNADPTNVKAVLLIGEVPVPYSGNAAWDGHTEHSGAWPCDNYYADINGNWTDIGVNNTTPARAANKNVPGDGKFDQITMPSAAELMVGRIDFRHLSTTTFGATPIELTKRYLLKSARWRTKQYTVKNQAIVDDNFGYFNGEAFAANGYKNAYPLVGEANVFAGDFRNDTDNNSFLLGYGTGGGSYSSAGGVGTSAQFAQDSVNIVFSNIFGSYHGDWDYEINPLMPSVLATKGGILTCAWAGRPNWFMQALASGETIGYCTKETQNAQFNGEYTGNSGTSGAHVALLGDPTTRAHIIAPVGEITNNNTCSTVELSWTAAPDTAILGYHVYRSLNYDGPYVRITTDLINNLAWTDQSPVSDTVFYQVRAIRIDRAPGGGLFYNNSIGLIRRIIFEQGVAPQVTIASPAVLTCAVNSVLLSSSISNPNQDSFDWYGPNGSLGNTASITVNTPGSYTLYVANAQGCTAVVATNVLEDIAMPNIQFPNLTFNCADPTAKLYLPIEPSNYTYAFDNKVYYPGEYIDFSIFTGAYTVVITSTANGCTSASTFLVNWDTQPPIVTASITDVNIPGGSNGTISLQPSPGTGPFLYAWDNGATTNSLVGLSAGIYSVTITNPTNGCTGTETYTVSSSVGTHQLDDLLTLTLAPNPADHQLIVQVNLTRKTPIVSALYNNVGQLITTQNVQLAQSATFQYDTHLLPSGNYWVVINTDQGRSTKAVVISH